MGDRRNIVLEFPEATVAAYTHWGGTEAPVDLKVGLVRGKARWNDWPYAARAIFCALVENDIQGDTGYGLEAVAKGSHDYCEASDRDLYVNFETQTVRWGEHTWPFAEYVALSEDDLLRLT